MRTPVFQVITSCGLDFLRRVSGSALLKEWNRTRIIRNIREFGWILVGQCVSVAGSLTLVRVLTERLSPAQYGQLALGLTIVGLTNQVLTGGLSAGIGRFYSIAIEKGDIQGYLQASQRLMLYTTAATAGLGLLLICSLWHLKYSEWIGISSAALVFSVLLGYNNSLSSVQSAARQRQVVALHSGLDACLKVLIAIIAVSVFGPSGTAVIIGYTVAAFAVTFSQLLFLKRTIPLGNQGTKEGSRWMQQIWSFSWPISVWGLFTWAQQSSDRWALDAFTNKHEVGLYSVLFQLGYTPICLVAGLVASFLAPILYQRSGAATDLNRNISVRRITIRIALASLAVTAVAFCAAELLHERIFGLLVAERYKNISYLLPWMILAGGMFSAGQFLSIKMMSDVELGGLAAVKIVTALTGLVMNIYFASRWGLTGVVAALVLFSVVYLSSMAILVARNAPTTAKT
jgi:O-antigen/teichoic acid export membrane protein